MKENYLDSRSPYIKSNVHGIEKTRKNILSFAAGEDRETSDTLLRQKITNISRKVVGEEIKKFAEVASREISEEFANLENRITETVHESLNKSLNENIKENVMILGHDIGKELDIKMHELNSLISEMEIKLENLEYFSKSLEEKVEENINKKEDVSSSPIFKIDSKRKDVVEKLETEIKEEAVNVVEDKKENLESLKDEVVKETVVEEKEGDENSKEDILVEEDPEYNTKLNYINEEIKVILPRFEKSGFLFKKNTFMTSLKDLEAKNFLENKEEYKDLDTEDKDKIEEILEDIIREIKINPKEKETIGDFLKRAYLRKYNNKK